MSGRAEEVTLKSTLWFCLLWLNVGWRIPLRYTVLVAKVSRNYGLLQACKAQKARRAKLFVINLPRAYKVLFHFVVQ